MAHASTTISDDLSTQRPGPPEPLSDDRTISRWLANKYFEYEYHGETPAIDVGDFLYMVYTSSESSQRSWLTESQLELPLMLLTARIKRDSDILILPTRAGSALCGVGLGMIPKENFPVEFPVLHNAMKDQDGHRWIVAPCSDGMLQVLELQRNPSKNESSGIEKKIEASEEKVAAAAAARGSGVDAGSPGYGCHWGIMIIDTKRNTARWIDGHLEIRRREGSKSCYIHQMLGAGKAAGKILGGYNLVMGLDVGLFQTSTLKWVPHDDRDNSYRGDSNSACGPYAFAMLEYLVRNPSYLEDLKATFAFKNQRKHIRTMAFDSCEARRRMQDMIGEKAEAGRNDDDLPYRLTAQILHILQSPDDVLCLLIEFQRKQEARRAESERRSKLGRPRGSKKDRAKNVRVQTRPVQDVYTDQDLEKMFALMDQNPERFARLSDPEQLDLAYHTLQEHNKAHESASREPAAVQNSGDEADSRWRKDRSPTQEIQASYYYAAALQNHNVNFFRLTTAQLRPFVAIHALGNSLTENMPTWKQRAVLTRAYGSFDRVCEADIQSWAHKDPVFGKRRSTPYQEILHVLKAVSKHVAGSKIRNEMRNWPVSCLRSFVAMQKPNRVSFQQPLRRDGPERPDRQDSVPAPAPVPAPVPAPADEVQEDPTDTKATDTTHEPLAPKSTTTTKRSAEKQATNSESKKLKAKKP